MASSLNRVFATKIDPNYHYFDAEKYSGSSSSGSETESIAEEDESYSSGNRSNGRRAGGVTPNANDKIMRNPTRRPNPKVSNRNALLARENRRRKKEHVEQLEKEVDDLRQDNIRIRKALRKKSKIVEELTREKNYLKCVIANRTGIMAILKSVHRSGLPITSSGLSYVTGSVKAPRAGSSDEGFGSSPNPAIGEEDNNFGTNDDDLGLASQAAATPVPFEEEFTSLPDMDELLTSMGSSSSEPVITTEHNYFEHINQTPLVESGSAAEAGVCVHIVPSGRVSVEFCGSCAKSSQQAWIEDLQER